MTLALYGKSRKRQGSLLLAAFLAIIAASVGGLAIITSAFAHHLEISTQLPTCQNNSAWNLTVSEGGWSGYREAVLTVTDNTTPVALRFSPFIDNGTASGSTTILQANGTGAVHTAGKVDQYLGDFTGNPTDIDDSGSPAIDASETVISSDEGWAGYAAGDVLKFDDGNELVKVVSVSGNDLTVTRGFGGTTATTHSDGSGSDIARWVRGALDTGSSAETVTWNLQADAPVCVKTIIVKKVVNAGAPAQNFSTDITNTDNPQGTVSNQTFSVATPYTDTFSGGLNTDDFTISEDTPPANWAHTGTSVLSGDATCPAFGGTWGSATAASVNNLAIGQTVTVCFKNTYTPSSGVSVDKSHDPAGPFGPGGTFKWKIALTVTGSATTAITNITDTIPSPFVAEAFGSYTKPAAITCTDGDANASTVTCSLASGSAVGTYTVEIDITVPAQLTQDQCHAYNNTATITGTNVPTTPGGPTNSQSDTDSVTVTCTPGTPNFSKSDGVKNGSNIQWTITIKNNSQFTSTFFVYDENAAYVSSTVCTSAGENPANSDFFTCTLAAGATGTLTLSTAIPAHTVCEPVNVTNTAYLVTSNTLTPEQAKNPQNQLSSDGGTYHEDAGQSASCVNIDKANATKVGNTLQWVVTLTNTSGVAQTVAVFDANSSLVSETCSNTVGESPADTYSCEVPAGGSATITLSTPYGGTGSACDSYQTSNTAFISGQANKSDTAQYSDTAQGGASCITVTKVKTATSNPPTWTVSIVNTAAVAQSVYVQDSDATLAQVVSGGSCTAGDTIMGNGVQCTVNANSTLILTVTKAYPAAATCEGTDVSNTVNVWVGTFASTPQTAPDKTADGGTFDNLNANPSLCTHTVKVCKIVVGNGDGIVDGGQFRFGSNPSNASATINSQTTEPAGDAVDGAQGTKNCVDLIVANTDTTIFEWGYRPGDGQGLTGTWNGDAAGFPRSGDHSTNSCDLQTNGTVAINSQTTEVTFCNKTNPRTEKILITKNFTGLNGYVPVAGDVPSFTLIPSTNTSCAAPAQQDSDTWTVECTVPAGWSAGGGTVKEAPKPNWKECQAVEENSLVQELSGLVSQVMSVIAIELLPQYANQFSFCNYPVGKVIVQKNDNTSNTNTGRPAQWNFEVDGSQTYQGNVALGGGQWTTLDVPFGSYTATETNGHFDPSICPTAGNPNGNGYTSTDLTPGSQSITQPGQTITFIFRNNDCGRVLGTGSLHVFKIRDINGNGQTDGGDSQIVWTVTIQGPEFPGGQVFNVPAAGLHLNGITEGVYTITEASGIGYTLVGVETTENLNLVVSASTSVTIADGTEDTVIFFNRPIGEIPVHKNAFTSHNGGANVAAPNDDDGWTITLTSAQCGINQVKVTDANGDALFTGLPLCNDYVVSEGAVNASSPGFVPLTAAQFTNITPNGVTLTFNNILRTQDPPCINCGPTVTPTPVTPTTTPPTTTVVPPTNTPVPPTATPTSPTQPVSTVGGERTPGPGQPTPIAPSTGGGVLGGTAGGFNLLLIVAGLLALTSGVSFLALGRKNRR